MGYSDVIPILGDFGRYQRRIYFLLCLPCMLCAFHRLGTVFLRADPPHRCLLANELPNSDYDLSLEILNTSFPYDEKVNKYSSCSMIQGNETVPCNGYIYDHRTYKTSTVMEWDLVCDREYLKNLADSLFLVGIMCGSFIFGQISDKYGRKLTFFISLAIQVPCGILAAFAPEYWTFTVCRAIVGATTEGVYLTAYIIAMEMGGPKYRFVAGVICNMLFAVGYILVALPAYFITNWRYLQLALTLPGIAFFSYWCFIPESVSWLLIKNRLPEAMKFVQAASKENRVKISEAELHDLLIGDIKQKNPEEKAATVVDIFRHPVLARRSLVIFFDWFVVIMTYYGLSWNTSNLGGNDYVNFVISGAVEIPAYSFLLLTLNRFGRKAVLCGCLVTAGVALLLITAVPEDHPWLVITLAMLAKLAIAACFSTMYVFSSEQFPTVIRNVGVGAGSTAGRFGAIFAPMINSTSEMWRPTPLIIFGIFVLIGGCLSLTLPETLNRQLPETMEDWKQSVKTKRSTTEEGD